MQNENDSNSNLNKEEKETIAVFSQKTSIKEVIYSTVPVDYPKTSESDVATVFNVTGWANPKDCWNNIRKIFFFIYLFFFTFNNLLIIKILFFRFNIH